jgi:hypothetical protein
MGQMAMQVQDVVVQLQMGTKWTTVMAQQGSQMLSAFGAGGAIAGGALAIGLAFYQMGERALEAFQKAKQSSQDFANTLARTLATSSPDELGTNWLEFDKTIKESTRQLGKEKTVMEDLADTFAYLNTMGRVSQQDLEDQRAQTQLDALQGMYAMEQRLVQLSGQQATIAELRAAGRKDEADEMERQLKLAQEIAKVQSYGMSAGTTEKVIANLQRQYAPPSTAQGNLLENVIGSFRRIMPDVLGPVSDVIQSQLNEQSRKLSAQASALQSVAFGGMKGDVDTSYGRGTSINPLNNGASRMIAELVKQSAVLQQQARSMDKGNAYLSEIEKAVKKFNLSYQ